MDLINRQVAIDTLEKIMADHPIDGYEDECQLINALKSLPSVTPERKTGKWIDRGYMKVGYHCSECGGYVVSGKENFCPNCGEDMREGQDGER